MFKCEVCGEEFEEQLSLRGHMGGAHKSKKKRVVKKDKPKIETTNPVTLSTEERAIADLVAADSEEWGPALREDELNDFSLMKNPMDLPPEALSMQNDKKYAFRWCERTPDRVRQLTRAAQRPLKWKVANKVNLPSMAHLVDSLLGGVCVLDQILLFKPWHDHSLVQQAKTDMAEITDQSGTLGAKSMQMSGDGVHARASVRSMQSDMPSEFEVQGSDVVMGEEGVDLGDLVVNE